MIDSVMHFGFTVRDLQRSLTFFCEGLGFEVLQTFERSAAYTRKVTGVGDTSIHAALIRGYGTVLELLEYRDREDRPQRGVPVYYPGSAHLCFEVRNIEQEMAFLTRKGAVFQKEITTVPFTQGMGNKVVYGWDPDGIAFELVERNRQE
ncbi:MAG: VOC family protein [Sphaerochaetaceae bacterium]|nr:VOC family protein [Sphaerochaetaceae bacterium]